MDEQTIARTGCNLGLEYPNDQRACGFDEFGRNNKARLKHECSCMAGIHQRGARGHLKTREKERDKKKTFKINNYHCIN